MLVHLALGEAFLECMSVSPMELDAGADLILGWDWISSHDLQHLYAAGTVGIRSGHHEVQLALLPAAARPSPAGAACAATLMGHGTLRRLLRAATPPPASHEGDSAGPALPPPPAAPSARVRSAWSKPLFADGAALCAAEAPRRTRPGRPAGPAPVPGGRACFVDGLAQLADGTELHLASFRPADADLHLEGHDDPAFDPLKLEFADVLNGPPRGLPPDRGIELELETGDAAMPRSRPVKRLSEGELAELRKQLHDLLDNGWIQHSTAGHAASVVFVRKPDGTWRICYDYRGLNAITRPAIEPMQHIDALLDSTRGFGVAIEIVVQDPTPQDCRSSKSWCEVCSPD